MTDKDEHAAAPPLSDDGASPDKEPPATPVVSLEAAGAMAASMLQSDIDLVRQVSSFAGNQVFQVRFGDRVAFLKLAHEVELRSEVAVLQTLHQRGVPVPIVDA